jgi:hypothetical protein
LKGECSFETFGWTCGSTGYLGVEGAREATRAVYPCPQCNTRAFLERAYVQVSKKRYVFTKCPCCGPGMPGEEIWNSAVETARECNPVVTDEVLMKLEATEARSWDTSSDLSKADKQRHPQGSVRFRADTIEPG